MATVPPPEPDKRLPTPGAADEPDRAPEWPEEERPFEEPVPVPHFEPGEEEDWL